MYNSILSLSDVRASTKITLLYSMSDCHIVSATFNIEHNLSLSLILVYSHYKFSETFLEGSDSC